MPPSKCVKICTSVLCDVSVVVIVVAAVVVSLSCEGGCVSVTLGSHLRPKDHNNNDDDDGNRDGDGDEEKNKKD